METLKINIVNRDAIAILKAMEQAGLITLPKKEIKNEDLSKPLRGTISSSQAKKMIETIEKEFPC